MSTISITRGTELLAAQLHLTVAELLVIIPDTETVNQSHSQALLQLLSQNTHTLEQLELYVTIRAFPLSGLQFSSLRTFHTDLPHRVVVQLLRLSLPVLSDLTIGTCGRGNCSIPSLANSWTQTGLRRVEGPALCTARIAEYCGAEIVVLRRERRLERMTQALSVLSATSTVHTLQLPFSAQYSDVFRRLSVQPGLRSQLYQVKLKQYRTDSTANIPQILQGWRSDLSGFPQLRKFTLHLSKMAGASEFKAQARSWLTQSHSQNLSLEECSLFVRGQSEMGLRRNVITGKVYRYHVG